MTEVDMLPQSEQIVHNERSIKILLTRNRESIEGTRSFNYNYKCDSRGLREERGEGWGGVVFARPFSLTCLYYLLRRVNENIFRKRGINILQVTNICEQRSHCKKTNSEICSNLFTFPLVYRENIGIYFVTLIRYFLWFR